MSKQHDVELILKLYELRRDERMRVARAWFFAEFQPTTAKDIIRLMSSGESPSASYRMITSYWDMAASFVNNGGIDEKLFLDANTEHVAIYAKLEPFLAEVRKLFGVEYMAHLEQLVLKIPNAQEQLAGRRKLLAAWGKASDKTAAEVPNNA